LNFIGFGEQYVARAEGFTVAARPHSTAFALVPSSQHQ
jgi:hypothetical protein